MSVSHYVDWDAPGRRLARARCGKLVQRDREHSITPSCPDCKRLTEEQEATADDVFGSTPPGAPVHSTLSDPLKGYGPKDHR